MSHFFTNANNVVLSGSTINAVHGNQTNITNNIVQSDNTKEILATLKPVDRSVHYVLPCMKGTRRVVFERVDRWLSDFEAPNILWLSGSPGAGKSAIASSLVEHLRGTGRLGSSFFFRRGDVALSGPAALWRTVASDLSQYDTSIMASLISELQAKRVDPERAEIELHFQHLIEEPLTQVGELRRANDSVRRAHESLQASEVAFRESQHRWQEIEPATRGRTLSDAEKQAMEKVRLDFQAKITARDVCKEELQKCEEYVKRIGENQTRCATARCTIYSWLTLSL